MGRHLYLVCIVLLIPLFVWISLQEKSDAPVACTLDARICEDGSAVGRTGPNCEFEACPTPKETPIADDLIRIHTPTPQARITSPLIVSGKARGNWFFEGSFPIQVVNWDGLIIGEGHATAQGEWTTTEFVPFTGTISYTLPTGTPYNKGTVIFKKDNPSGLSEHDDVREVPIFFIEVPQ